MQLTPEESRQFAESVVAVARHYDVGASAKALDWTNLLTTMGSIYGVRVMAMTVRRKAGSPGMGHNGGPALDEQPAPSGMVYGMAPAGSA